MSFIAELKRRNVFRVGIAYAVATWLLMQATDLVFPRIGLSESAITLVFALLGIGFIPALIFAWAFELTPDGIKKERDVDRSQSMTQTTGRKLDFTIISILLVALGYFAYDKFVLTPASHAPVAASEASIEPVEKEKSIAVLPFVNMSDDAGNEFFSDGISEEILNSLAKVKELKVAGRTSSFSFKGQNQDLRQIGETLGVDHILEGSVRKFGDQVRITAQLIQVSDGFHLWSDSYDRKLDNVFAIQDEIATAILEQLKATLLEEEVEALAATRTDSQAYEYYLLAKQRLYERTELTIQAAAELLDKAIAIDPDYAPAYAQRGIAALLQSVGSYGTIPEDQARTQARLYLDKAIELDENLAEAWAGLGLYYNGPPRETGKSIPALEKALALNPGLINAANWLTLSYWEVNRLQDSLELLNEIAERDPLYKPAIGNRAYVLASMGRADEATAKLDEIEPFMPGDQQILGSRAWIDFSQGRPAAGLKKAEAALALAPNDRTNKVSVNQGRYETHQYELVFDDDWSDYHLSALFNLGRIEEATIEARRFAARGQVDRLFALLNANNQPELLVDYLEEHWTDLEAFQIDVPANAMSGYREMVDVAYAYRKTGNQARFSQAMAFLDAANQQTYAEGNRSNGFFAVVAAYHALAGDNEQALDWLAQAVDGGWITSSKISKENPYFREMDGNPEYEAIQARMIEHLNNERSQLGLEPVAT